MLSTNTDIEDIEEWLGKLGLGLHDSRIKKISFKNDVLTIELDTIFQYTKGEEKLWIVFNA